MNLPALTEDPNVSKALIKASEAAPEEMALVTRWIGDIKEKNVMALGMGEAFALTDSHGQIKAFKQVVYLSEREKTLVNIKGQFSISAQGYEVLAEAAGAICIFPKEVFVNGEWQPNPYREKDPETGALVGVHARAIAFRYSDKGILTTSDWTHFYDVKAYRVIDLLAKASKTPQAFKVLPNRIGEPKEDGTWIDYPFDTSATLWVNSSHSEVLKWYSEIINREKKSIDFAQTFAKRNALKHLLALQKAPGPEWWVPIICWRPTNSDSMRWDESQYTALQDRAIEMTRGKDGEYRSGRSISSEDEELAAEEPMTDPEDQADVIEVKPESKKSEAPTKEEPITQAAPKLTRKEEKSFMNLRATADMFPEEYAAAIKQHGEPTTADEAEAVYHAINTILDQQAEG